MRNLFSPLWLLVAFIATTLFYSNSYSGVSGDAFSQDNPEKLIRSSHYESRNPRYFVVCSDNTTATFFEQGLTKIGDVTRFRFLQGDYFYFADVPYPTLTILNKFLGAPYCASRFNNISSSRWVGGDDPNSGYEVHCNNRTSSFFPIAKLKQTLGDNWRIGVWSDKLFRAGRLEDFDIRIGRPYCTRGSIAYSEFRAGGKFGTEYYVICGDGHDISFDRTKHGYPVAYVLSNDQKGIVRMTQNLNITHAVDLNRTDQTVGKLFCSGKVVPDR